MQSGIYIAALAGTVIAGGVINAQSGLSVAHDSRTFELRTYTSEPGKLEALHARFRDHTTALFERHGMTNVGYFVPTDRTDTLVYILAHESRQAAERSWQGFRNDSDWQDAAEASRVNGRLVANVDSVFMSATDYSLLK